MKEAIFEGIRLIIKEQLHKPELDITQTTVLYGDLGVGSIILTEFIINLEDKSHLEIPDEDVKDMECVGGMMEYLYNRVD